MEDGLSARGWRWTVFTWTLLWLYITWLRIVGAIPPARISFTLDGLSNVIMEAKNNWKRSTFLFQAGVLLRCWDVLKWEVMLSLTATIESRLLVLILLSWWFLRHCTKWFFNLDLRRFCLLSLNPRGVKVLGSRSDQKGCFYFILFIYFLCLTGHQTGKNVRWLYPHERSLPRRRDI